MDEKMGLIAQIQELTNSRGNADRLISKMFSTVVEMAPSDVRDVVREKMDMVRIAIIEAASKSAVECYMEKFTTDELRELVAMYSSPVYAKAQSFQVEMEKNGTEIAKQVWAPHFEELKALLDVN